MRGIAVFVTGLFVLTTIVMFQGLLYEPIIDLVASDEAVQEAGWADDAEQIGDTNLQYVPLLYIAYLLVWAAGWYVRRQLMTTTVRR